MSIDGKIKAVVYTEEVNDILRGLKEDLDRYFEVVDSGTIMPRSEGKVTHCDLTFGHWFYKLATRHWCKKPTKTIYIKDRRFLRIGNKL